MSKATKGWAVVTPSGKFCAVAIKRSDAISDAEINFYLGWGGWRFMKRLGYHCVRVTITEEPTDE